MGRAPCCDKANVKKGPWSPEEDVKLKSFIERHGTGGNWISLPQKIGLKRCGKSCRLRWLNYLRPNLKHGGFSEEEDSIICSLYINIGSRWSVIAGQLPGRTDNDIKNYWNTRLKKKLLGKQRQHHTRRATKQQEPKKPEENGAIAISNVGGRSCSATSYWLPEPALPAYTEAADDRASFKRFLMKLGGGISCSDEAEIPSLLAAHDHPFLYDNNASLITTSSHSSSFNECLQSQASSFSTDLDYMFACNQVKLEGFDSFYGMSTGIEGEISGFLDMPETVNWNGASSWMHPPLASSAANHHDSIQQCSYQGQMNLGMH